MWNLSSTLFHSETFLANNLSFHVAGDDVMRCLRNSVKKMLDNHHMVFNGMMSRLKIDRDCNIELGFTTLAEELFINTGSSTSNHGVSWGKIIALYAFGAR